ncbi:hypothetical protein DFH09DRAFT_1099442 [Mycena vulgaris]|nr:hypothetical protein DFH09DRAFT_1099442 [Mycena vulgaris]
MVSKLVPLGKRGLPETEKLYRNLEAVRDKARAWMELSSDTRRRTQIKASPETTELAAGQCREVDADYQERQRQSKFINKFGRRAYNKHYAPLHKTQGNGRHLPGVGFAWNDEDHSKKTKKKSSRSKSKSKDIADSPV